MDRFGRGCIPIAATKRTDGGLELFPVNVDVDGSELFPKGLDKLGNVGGTVNAVGFGGKREGLAAVGGGGGIPSDNAFAMRLNGKGVGGGGGKLNPNGRFGMRLANGFGGGGRVNVSLLVVLVVALSRADKRFGGGVGRFVFVMIGVVVVVVVFDGVVACTVDALPLAWASI